MAALHSIHLLLLLLLLPPTHVILHKHTGCHLLPSIVSILARARSCIHPQKPFKIMIQQPINNQTSSSTTDLPCFLSLLPSLLVGENAVDELGFMPPSPESSSEIFKLVELEEGGIILGISHKALVPLFRLAMANRRRKINDIDQMANHLAILLACPDTRTEWNVREHKWRNSHNTTPMSIDVMHNELKFVDLLLSLHPKSSEAFVYRTKLYEKLMTTYHDQHQEMELCSRELAKCRNAFLHRYPRCYYAQAYRQHVLQWCNSITLHEERASMRTWLATHVSDSGASQHLSNVVSLLLDRDSVFIMNQAHRELDAIEDLDWIEELINMYGDHEALFLYYRAAASRFLDVVMESMMMNQATLHRSSSCVCVQLSSPFDSWKWWWQDASRRRQTTVTKSQPLHPDVLLQMMFCLAIKTLQNGLQQEGKQGLLLLRFAIWLGREISVRIFAIPIENLLPPRDGQTTLPSRRKELAEAATTAVNEALMFCHGLGRLFVTTMLRTTTATTKKTGIKSKGE